MLGCILRKPEIVLEEWLAYVARRPDIFRRPPPRNIINPFTKQPAIWTSPAGEFKVFLNGVDAGTIEHIPDGETQGGLILYSIPGWSDPIRELARQIAADLGATIDLLPPGESDPD
jgi:hypothetical protein